MDYPESFQLQADYQPAGDQQQAINRLVNGFFSGVSRATLKGVTGSGKTYTMAQIIQKIQKPTLVLSHNKTLAAQLYREFKTFFPHNAVEYFVSYYDYYQPEAYVPSRDLYIEKDASINDEIDRLRLSATSSLMDRKDVIVVATVSCIYGTGNPTHFKNMRVNLRLGANLDIKKLSQQLIYLQYQRNDAILERGNFRIRGDIIEIYPAYLEQAYRITLDWDEIASIKIFNPTTGAVIRNETFVVINPAAHFVMPQEEIDLALAHIQTELETQVAYFEKKGKIVEAQRIKARTEYDMEMMKEAGYCSGIENYSRHLDQREVGERPAVLLDYFPEDFLCIVDESHVSIPQIGGMFNGDRARKLNLVEFGFRLPSALDNRPLVYQEFDSLVPQLLYVSATPSKEEMEKSTLVVEQIIRPTGLVDPEISVRKTEGQIEDLFAEINRRIEKKERVLITTLTKKMAESLSDYLLNAGIKTRYMHSEIETIERVEILKSLRLGEIDVIVGINLLREGLDLPEVSLVAILDADKIGFLRSTTSLIQTIGRAARNVNGKVIMYADRYSDAMKEAIAETNRRRAIQMAYNEKYHIEPKSIIKKIDDILVREKENLEKESKTVHTILSRHNQFDPNEKRKLHKELEERMNEHAKNLEFEEAAEIRDLLKELTGNRSK